MALPPDAWRPHDWSSISVSHRSVMVERMVRPGESARPGACPFSSPAEICLHAHVTSEDFPAVLRALVDRLARVIDICVPTVVNLGVPEACQPRIGPVSGT